MENVFLTLKERGFLKQLSHHEEIERLFATEKVTCYIGFDPTAASLQLGHLFQLMTLIHLQRAGHRPIILVGGGTVMAGDPSGKTEMRSLISVEEIEANKAGMKEQLSRFLDFSEGKALMVDNADWLLKLNYVSFLREIGSHFSVNRMLQAECYKARMDRPDAGLSFIELNYMIMQSYDFLHLFRTYGCKVQIGGDDQWSNILSGADLIRRVDRAEAFAMTTPLVTMSDGSKMGKSVAGAVWLDPERTSPYEFYQYWRNIPDADVRDFLGIFTFLPIEEVDRLGKASGSDINESKKVLAFEVTKMIHGEKAASEAAAAAAALFGGGGDDSAMPSTLISEEQLSAGLPIIDILVQCGLCASKSEARRLIQQGGLTVNGTRVETFELLLQKQDLQEDKIVLRKGKKEFHALRVE